MMATDEELITDDDLRERHPEIAAYLDIPGIGATTELTAGSVQLDVEQERRALAVERAATALVDADAAPVLAVADYVITGRNLFVEAE